MGASLIRQRADGGAGRVVQWCCKGLKNLLRLNRDVTRKVKYYVNYRQVNGIIYSGAGHVSALSARSNPWRKWCTVSLVCFGRFARHKCLSSSLLLSKDGVREVFRVFLCNNRGRKYGTIFLVAWDIAAGRPLWNRWLLKLTGFCGIVGNIKNL